jgi:hypothetical protein
VSARPDDRIGSSLDHLFGTWTRKESEAFLRSIGSTERLDPELWE